MGKSIRVLIREFLNNNLMENINVDDILDKISQYGIDSLSNHELTLLKSYSDKSIDAKQEIEKHKNKYKTSKSIPDAFGRGTSDEELEKNIGRYVQFKTTDTQKYGMLVTKGTIFEIVAIQTHWGYVNGKYVSDKVGYRIAEVGIDGSFGRVGDVDVVTFVNYSEEDATKINEFILDNWDLRGREWLTKKRDWVKKNGINF